MTTDVGTTPRKPLTPTQRLKLFEDHKGICCLCSLKIKRGDAWIDEHIRPLGLGGSNDLSNRGPAHKLCAEVKTEQDMDRINKAKRQKQADLGIKAAAGAPLVGRSMPIGKARKEHPIPLPPRRSMFVEG